MHPSSIKAQEDYCTKYNLPLVAPADGICFFCGEDIYDTITAETAVQSHITVCPACHRNFSE